MTFTGKPLLVSLSPTLCPPDLSAQNPRTARRRPGTYPGFFNRYCDESRDVTGVAVTPTSRVDDAGALSHWVNRLGYRSAARRPTTCTPDYSTLAIQSDPPLVYNHDPSHSVLLSHCPFARSLALTTNPPPPIVPLS